MDLCLWQGHRQQAYLAENNGLANGDATVDVTEGLVFAFPVLTQHVILPDVVQGQFLFSQLDNIGVRNDSFSKLPHRVLKGCRKEEHLRTKPLDTDALIGESLGVNHHICFIQDKHTDLCQINHPRSTNNNLLEHTSVSSNGIHHFNIHAELAHPFNHTTGLQSQFIGRSQAEAL
uniref:Uncharacterized protein n=1 Tax=Mus spicilegus TaxID=10103 RepID=A0A8C6GS41_MUSSI